MIKNLLIIIPLHQIDKNETPLLERAISSVPNEYQVVISTTKDTYETLTKISFDYEVVEKESSILVKRFNGQWKDLGTWNTLTEAMEENIVGKGTMNENCDGVHIVNELDGTTEAVKPVEEEIKFEPVEKDGYYTCPYTIMTIRK